MAQQKGINLPKYPAWMRVDLPFHTWVFPKIVFSPQIINSNMVFPYFHHPFWVTPIFGNTHMDPPRNNRQGVPIPGASVRATSSRPDNETATYDANGKCGDPGWGDPFPFLGPPQGHHFRSVGHGWSGWLAVPTSASLLPYPQLFFLPSWHG